MTKAKPTIDAKDANASKVTKDAKATKDAKVTNAPKDANAPKATKEAKAPKATKNGEKGKDVNDIDKTEGGAPVKVTYAKLLTGINKITNKKDNTINKDALVNLLETLNVSEVFKNQKNKKRANNGEKKHITLYNKFTSWIIKEMKDDINQQSKMKKAASIWTQEYKGNPAKIAEFKKKAGIVE